MLGITYAASKDEDDEDGLSYPCFLDAVLDLAFECKRNVAAELEAAVRRKQQQVKPRGGRLVLQMRDPPWDGCGIARAAQQSRN